jgi:glycerate dehydrogenase
MQTDAIQSAAFLDLASVHPSDLDLGALKAAVPQWQWFDQVSAEELRAMLPETDVIVTNKYVLDESLFSRACRLRLVCVAATGTNNIDLEAARRNNVAVCNVTAYATPAVVQHVFALLLSLTTRLDEYTHDVRSGEWSRSRFFCLLDHPVRELAGKTLGLYGYGELGRGVARVARALGMEVLVAKRNAGDTREGRLALPALLPQVDVLSLHCPLNAETRGLIGAD